MLQKKGMVASKTASPSISVVLAVADREGVDPTELDPSLAEVVDPDALDAVFDGGDARDGTIRFEYHGYRVEVRGDGTVSLWD